MSLFDAEGCDDAEKSVAYCDALNIERLESKLAACEAKLERAMKALERISHAKADQLDHALDISIIRRAASVATQALKEIREK